ncbi:hypothetical protein CffCFBP3418_12760 [Curtobacterium flaccumfaciens pv. flaccumfaciens]|nr:hypothetical protein CffCFBP3418_12760 [Curtobacterium flaccumfaciens pv. flaccumfaciens]
MPGRSLATIAAPTAAASSRVTGRPSWSPFAAGIDGTATTVADARVSSTSVRPRWPRNVTGRPAACCPSWAR